MSADPAVSVVVPTHRRKARLEALLNALTEQTLSSDRFEVIVVDDGSSDGTAELLAVEREGERLPLKVLRRERPGGPATARDDGWRAATAPLVAFTDDDCAPDPEWLEAGLRAAESNPGSIVQGRTRPAPSELGATGPFSRTIDVPEADPAFQTCNVFYPRALLDDLDGFDTEAFGRAPGGEDSDLAWRAIESGAGAVFAPDALVDHAVADLGPIGKLRVAARWTTPMLAYVRHPELRRSHFALGVFWKGTHYHLTRALLALFLPRRLRSLKPWLARPYLVNVARRARDDGASALLWPYYAIHDLVELSAVARAAIRYRAPML